LLNFEFHVASFLEAQRLMREGWPSHIVTALGTADIIPSDGPHHYVMEFDDTEVVDEKGKWVAITREDVERLLEFTRDIPEGARLLVHCRAGKSRSTALAMGIAMQHGMTAQQAFSTVQEIRPVLIPNRRIVDLIDEILDRDDKLTPIVAAYYERLIIPGITLPDRGGANL
jgi:predicted protein tyrosine phosphatase